MLAVNVLWVVHRVQVFVPHLVRVGARTRGEYRLVGRADGDAEHGCLCASKHAVVAISETLRTELDAMGLPIGLTVAGPGLVRTPLAEGLFTLAQRMTMRWPNTSRRPRR